jgi:hypothetical protein
MLNPTVYFILKCLLSGLMVGVVSELAKRSTWVAAVVVSLPLTSILALIWVYHESHDAKTLIEVSNGVALIFLPSLAFFIAFSLLMKQGLHFYVSLPVSCMTLAVVYAGYIKILDYAGLIK